MNNFISFKRFFSICFVLTFFVSSTLYSNDYPSTSVGVLDLNKVLVESKAAKKAAEEIDEIAKNIELQIKETDQKMIDEQNKLIEAQSIMAPEAFEEKRKDYENSVNEYNVERQQRLLSIDELINDSRAIILESLKPILEEISNEKGITVLLEKGNILLNADNMDITDEVIKRLNKELPNIEISFEN